MSPPSPARWIAAALSLALVAACSGGKATVDPATFLAQANEACQKLAADDVAGRAALGPSPTAEAYANYIRASYGPEAIQTYQRLAALPIPSNQVDAIQLLLTDVIAEVRLIDADPATGGNKVNQAQLVDKLHRAGLTACGAGFATALDRKTFLDRAGALCRDLNVALGTTARDAGVTAAATAEKKAAFVTGSAIPQYHALVRSIEELGYPPDDAVALAKLVADWRAELDRQEADPTLFFASGRREATAVNEAWNRAGAPDCGVNAQIAIG